MVTKDLPLGGGHTVQCTDDILWNYTLEACIILLANDIPISLILKKAETPSSKINKQ